MMHDIDMLICKINVLMDRYKKLSELPDDEMVASEVPNDIFRKAFNETSVVLAQAADTIESLSAKLDAASGSGQEVRWIPCKDRLPEIEQDVLLSFRSLDVRVGYRANTEGYFYVYGEEYVAFKNTLAWMPLPEEYHE